MDKFDCIIVLGCSPLNDELRNFLDARLTKAIELYKAGYSDTIILSGGKERTGINEAKAMKKFVIKRLPKANMILEDGSSSTYWNAINSFRITKKMKFDSAIIVTNNFHIWRARFIFLKVFKGFRLRFEGSKENLTQGRRAYLTIVEFGKVLLYFMGVR